MPPEARFQTYLFSYEFQGARWSVEIPAASEAEARRRALLMAEARYDGVLQFKIPVPSGLLAPRLLGGARLALLIRKGPPMFSRFRRLIPVALGLALLAGAFFVSRPRAPEAEAPAHADFSDAKGGPQTPEPEAAAPAERPARRHRLADAGWRLVETTQQGEDRRIEKPVALIGGTPVEAPEWYALVHAVWPVSAETRRQFPDRSFTDDEEERGQCGGKLYRLNGLSFVETAAHCLLARDGSAPRRVEICLQPFSRTSCRARYALHGFAVDASYEADWAAGLRDDRALLVLPEDPGGGAALPQTPRAEMEAGEVIHVFAMGPDETGALSEQVRTCAQEVADVRRTRVETRATPACAIRQGDSGSPAGRLIGGEFVQTLIVSGIDGARNFYAPIRPDKVRAAAEVWE